MQLPSTATCIFCQKNPLFSVSSNSLSDLTVKLSWLWRRARIAQWGQSRLEIAKNKSYSPSRFNEIFFSNSIVFNNRKKNLNILNFLEGKNSNATLLRFLPRCALQSFFFFYFSSCGKFRPSREVPNSNRETLLPIIMMRDGILEPYDSSSTMPPKVTLKHYCSQLASITLVSETLSTN